MKGFGKQVIAGLTVALFITTATFFVIYTAGFADNDQIAVTTANNNASSSEPTPITPIFTVTPTFMPTPTPTLTPTPTPDPVRIGTTPYPDLQTAYVDAKEDPVVIKMLAGTQPGYLDAFRPIDVTIKGGFDTTYTTNSGITVINGVGFTLWDGSITVEQVAIGKE
jgi:hypothetical protein